MKRVLKYGALGLAVLVLGVAAFVAMTVIPLQKAPASQAFEGMHFVSDGMSTIAIVPTGPNQVVLVDSGMDDHAVKVLAELSKLGMTAESVAAILFTHGHSDHIGGAKQFPHAELMALEPDVGLIAGSTGTHGPVTRFMSVSPTGLKVSRILKDGETFTVGQATVKVFAVPGHTIGSAAYLIDGVLFLGDSANATTSGKLQSTVWMFSDDLGQNESALRSLEKSLREGGDPVKAIAFGHSGVLTQGLTPLSDWAKAHPG